MTKLGTFWEGLILIVIAVAMVVASAFIPATAPTVIGFLSDSGKVVFGLGIGYAGGGAVARQ